MCIVEKKFLKDWEIYLYGHIELTTGLYCGVMTCQIVLFALINILLDTCLMNRYKKRGGYEGHRPPLLDVRKDVLDHENEVR